MVFLKEDFIRKSTKTTILTKYIHIIIMYIPHQLHMQTLYIIQNEMISTFTKWTAIEESSSTYIRGLSKINTNILGI